MRLLTWAAACDADFELELDLYVKGEKDHIDNTRENRQLAYELCTQVDDRPPTSGRRHYTSGSAARCRAA